MDKYICIHGHFYQPPRENPWLESVEIQDSAYPYHDWNERIAYECYGPNGSARILNGDGRIIEIVNNYSKISFNFGPTLLVWLEKFEPEKYRAIIEADKESAERFSGHGSAMAQVYNHMIMPLADSRDKRTQIIWGIRDFVHRFGRDPEGMWLAETAADLETLDLMAEHGITFTVLAPNQASRVRRIGENDWTDVSATGIDPKMAYKIRLPSGKEMNLFFYDGPISQAIAFEQLLKNGQTFADRLLGAFSDESPMPQLVHIATDGETYGHHHRHGEMALAYALSYIEANNLANVTNYGEYLEKNPPTHEVEIFEYSSWSCVHGVERWKSDCGCCSGGRPDWNQAWRAPLRNALDWLRDTLAPQYEQTASEMIKDPWDARNDYLDVILDRSPEVVDNFFEKHRTKELQDGDIVKCLQLFEIQRHLMLMYTSCGWFFDDLSGIETVQVIEYAGRAVQVAGALFGKDYRTRFLELLELAKSNIPEHGSGRNIYEKWVEPTALDLTRVAVHYSITSLFEDLGEHTTIDAYSASKHDFTGSQTGRVKLVLGQAKITSDITRESQDFCYGVIHLGDHNISCGIKDRQNESQFKELENDVTTPFSEANFPDTLRQLDKHFGSAPYSLVSLFHDEQRKILDLILEPGLQDAEVTYGQFYELYAPMMRFFKNSNLPIPKIMSYSGELYLNSRLRRAFKQTPLDPQTIEQLISEANSTGIQMDTATLEFTVRRTLERNSMYLAENPTDTENIGRFHEAISLLPIFPFEVDIWKVQNTCFKILKEVFPKMVENAKQGAAEAEDWVRLFTEIADRLWIMIPE